MTTKGAVSEAQLPQTLPLEGTQVQFQDRDAILRSVPPFLSDDDLAQILRMTKEWVRSHAHEIPGFQRLGAYYRFRSSSVEKWLGSLDCLLCADEVAALLKVPPSWVYANADEIPSVIRLWRYVRFRLKPLRQFLGESKVAQ